MQTAHTQQNTHRRWILIGLGIVLILLCACTTSTETTAVATSITTPTTATVRTIAPTPTHTARPTPTSIPTARPTVALVHIAATQAPAATPCPQPCNPWRYSFAPGSYIYAPAAGFCTVFACISNFVNGRGYVVECNDGEYSKSGGIRGVCSYHGGEERPLYAH